MSHTNLHSLVREMIEPLFFKCITDGSRFNSFFRENHAWIYVTKGTKVWTVYELNRLRYVPLDDVDLHARTEFSVDLSYVHFQEHLIHPFDVSSSLLVKVTAEKVTFHLQDSTLLEKGFYDGLSNPEIARLSNALMKRVSSEIDHKRAMAGGR